MKSYGGIMLAEAHVETWPYQQPVGSWRAFISEHEGAKWAETDDPTIPYHQPGTTPPQQLEGLELVRPNGTYACAGNVDHEHWPEKRRAEAQEPGRHIREHLDDDGRISVGGPDSVARRGCPPTTLGLMYWTSS